ncbi:hypothetical protein L3049_10540 [Labilibaculum sp. DW002]|uniref:DUF3592 domain-containing protein n=1 Tax=Paralabilibaculum antarcticum TaxID=2912572 RepID=A0ABT5VSN9_9BACT|nr:DUF3592 domain-containing protein [Labilibaculum sp. DW002]MDE5418446.1 hypothetical protein [Labilibaculum sp. DW002]
MEINEKQIMIVIVGLAITCFIFFGVKDLYQRSRLTKEGIYTIGTITKFVDDHHSAPTAHYEFKYKNVEYRGGVIVNHMQNTLISKRFFVIFLPDAPSKSKMLIGNPVPSVLKNAPPAGWLKLPD